MVRNDGVRYRRLLRSGTRESVIRCGLLLKRRVSLSVEGSRSDTSKVIILARGMCPPHAPKNAPSNFIKRVCRKANKDFGWTHFVGYSDEHAGEVGALYRMVGWECLGKSKQGTKIAFISPTGQRISSYNFNRKSDKKFYALGWDGEEGKYAFLRRLGWTEHTEAIKTRWLRVEPTGRDSMGRTE
jgi:hypothetical protein